MGNNLDKFIRSRIQDRQYELKESYWLEAEKMLERQDRNRSGRPFSLWFVFMLLGAFLMYLAYPALEGDVDTPLPMQQDTFESPSAAVSDNSESFLSGDVVSPYLETAGSETGVQDNEVSGLVSSNVSDENTVATIQKRASQQAHLLTATKKRTGDPDELSSTSETPSEEDLLSGNEIGKAGKYANQQTEASTAYRSNDNTAENPEKSGNIENILSAPRQEAGMKKSGFEFISLDRKSSPFYNQQLSQGRKWFDMNLPELEIRADLEEKRIKPRVHRYLFGGLAWSAISQAQGPFPAGMGAGVNLNYKFQHRWSLHSDLFLYYRKGEFEPVKQSSVIEHDFGVKNSVYQMVPSRAIELTMPLYVRYHINKHGIEAGISIDYLLALHGDIMVYSHESVPGTTNDDGVTITREENIQLDAGGLKRFDLHFMTGYHWHFSHNMSAGARIYFNPWSNRLGDPLPTINANNVIDESRKVRDIYVENNPLRNLGNWTFGVDLRYYLFNNQNNRKYGRRR